MTVAATPPGTPNRRIVELLRSATVEVSARDPGSAARLAGWIPRGAEVYVAFLPNHSHHELVAAAAALKKAGYAPVPHVAARNLASVTQLEDYLARAAGEAGVDRVLAIGGDTDPPRGPFASALDLIESGALERHAIRAVGLAGHPEGNRRVPDALLAGAIPAKVKAARARGLRVWIVTQFCFEPEPVLSFAKAMKQQAPGVPVHAGIAGPANAGTLLKFAVKCGIGNSLRAVRTHADSVTRLLGGARPDELVKALAQSSDLITGLHFFPFGGLEAMRRWIDEAAKAPA